MEGHPHVRPCLPVPPIVHLLTSSFPTRSASNPRSDPIPPPYLFQSADSSTSPLPSSDPPPPPPPPPPPYPSAGPISSAAILTASNHILPNPISSISAPSSSVSSPPVGSSLFPPSLSAASPPLSLALSSAPASLAVITSHITPQFPTPSPTAGTSSPNLPSSSAPSFSLELPLHPLLPNQPLPQVIHTSLSTSQPPTPSHQAQTSQHIPQAPPSSGPQSRTIPANNHHSSAPKYHQPSYAQVARGPRGPGFVRSHASDIESFARLPRTGINIISGSREGLPSFSFVNTDLSKVEGLYSKALLMKFHGGRPSLESSHKEILSWGIEQPFFIGPLSSRSFLLRFQDEKDLLKVLSCPSTSLITYPYRVFRWHNLCHLREDSCLAPVWISLPRLPLQCFILEFLELVANKIGRFLCLDKATATLAHPSAARLCVEIDLRKSPP